MAAKRDYYDVLGVARNADTGTIKKATVNWRKSTTRIRMQEMSRQRRNLRKLPKHIIY